MNRRTFIRTGLACGGLLALPPVPRLPGPLQPVERLYVAMGTVVRFVVYHEKPAEAAAAVSEASDLIQQIHDLMSVQDPQSELSRWNRSRRGLHEPFHPLTAAAVDQALGMNRLTGGRFDASVGAAVAAIERSKPPLRQSDRQVDWDSGNRRLAKSEGVELDLGGSAKGWAVDRAVDVLQRHGAFAALVNAGGDLRVFGSPPGSDAWPVGIRDPRGRGILGILHVRDGAVATSGDYEADGSTLVDPRDLARVRLGGGVSVVARDCGTADATATALCVDPDLKLLPGDCMGLIARRMNGVLHIETSPGFQLGQPALTDR